jgi:hypothetical protein
LCPAPPGANLGFVMKPHTQAATASLSLSFFAALALALALAVFLVPTAIRAQNINQTGQSGPYELTLKVLPAESFAGPHAEMAHDGGAAPAQVNSPLHPNHHLVVFIKKDGKPVEDAQVKITYRRGTEAWQTLPVARMHVVGKGLETTHYGNNVKLASGKYEVRVSVDGQKPATFRFTLK